MYVTIRLRDAPADADTNADAVAEAADATAGADDPAAVPADLSAAAAELGVRVRRLHPGVQDDELRRYVYAEVEDAAQAEAVAARVGLLPSVDAAYVKPPEGPP
jgi:hypothetical protein